MMLSKNCKNHTTKSVINVVYTIKNSTCLCNIMDPQLENVDSFILLQYHTNNYFMKCYRQGRQTGEVGASQPPLNFGWGGGVNTCQPP